MGYCNDCGCKKYDGACTNCHEEIYIARQYVDNGDFIPHEDTDFTKKLRECEKQIQEGAK